RSKHIAKVNGGLLVSSGVTINELISFCLKSNLGGIGTLFGIPSTVGGAVVNSLGAFGCEFCNFIEYVVGFYTTCLNKKVKILNKDCGFAYRDSIFKHMNFIITAVKLNLPSEQPTTLKQTMVESIKKKTATQPVEMPSAGSVFKRQSEFIPAKVIDELNLKGVRFGDAQISTKHAGFIVNLGNARFKDTIKLIEYVKRKVHHKTQHKLTCEIEIVKSIKKFYK
ncbi:MAG: UDP-N-acetylmuramate dehydrogenase, partial [Clostridia bacterium]|nr:UDP-N-acetylmuramate dehydrogenase [Clostridia bacterium]